MLQRHTFLFVLLLAPIVARGGEAKKAGKPAAANLYVDVSGKLINRLVGKPVDECEPYTDIIDTTPVYGQRRTLGTLRAELVPDAERGVVDLVVDGTTYSNEVGVRRLVRIFSTTTTTFEARQRVTLDKDGITSRRERPFAHASITLLKVTDFFGDTDTAPAILTRAAFRADQRRIEGIVAGKAMCESSEKLESRINPVLEKASKRIAEGIAFVKLAGADVPPLRFETTEKMVGVRLAIGAFAAKAPPLAPESADLTVRLHESAVNAVAATALSGRTFRLSDVLATVHLVTEPLLRDPRSEAERLKAVKGIETLLKKLSGESPGLTLAKGDPLTFRFTDAGFRVETHIASVNAAGKILLDVRVRATYRVENTAKGPRGVRTGPVLLLTDKKSEAPLEIVQDLLMALGNEVFPERTSLANVELPNELGELGPLSALRVESRDGWMSLSWTVRK